MLGNLTLDVWKLAGPSYCGDDWDEQLVWIQHAAKQFSYSPFLSVLCDIQADFFVTSLSDL